MTNCNCACPPASFPPPIDIAPGLSRLPRQVLGFPEYRDALLAAIRSKSALADWRAREGDDLGVMMLEWAAYVFDVTAFYDARTTEEMYIRTTRDLPSAREIAALIGYRPRPAIAATAKLAAITDPNTSVTVPKGMQFRSNGFDNNPPQIFEADADVLADSAKNQWQLAPIAPTKMAADSPILFATQSLRLAKGMVVKLAMHAKKPVLGEVIDIANYSGLDDKSYAQPVFATPVSLPAGTSLAGVDATAAPQTARVASFGSTAATPLILDGLYPQLTVGLEIALKTAKGLDLFKIAAAGVYNNLATDNREQSLPVVFATMIGVEKIGAMPPPTSGTVTIYSNFQRVGSLALPALAKIDPSQIAGKLMLSGLNTPLAETADTFPLLDKRDTGTGVAGTVSVNSLGRGALQVSAAPDGSAPLFTPIRMFGNTIAISRGESVSGEVLGSAAAVTPFQTFKLQRKPLTYRPSLTAASGYASTLQVRVNGILWREVDSFFKAAASDQVYIVRHDEAGETYVTFGDGTYGAYPPAGSNNISANYRTGAGSAEPPAMTIRQAVSPLKGLSQIFNPVGASGGADAESPESIRGGAGLSTLTFGRAVSFEDFEALARNYPGIVNATTGWAWDHALQRAVVTIWIIADGGDPSDDLCNWLMARADPAIQITVTPAKAIPVHLTVAIDSDPAYEAATVEANMIAALTDAQSGILSHANAAIGGSIFLSALFEAVLAVPGVQEIADLSAAVDGVPLAPGSFALTASEGAFLDFLPFDNR